MSKFRLYLNYFLIINILNIDSTKHKVNFIFLSKCIKINDPFYSKNYVNNITLLKIFLVFTYSYMY